MSAAAKSKLLIRRKRPIEEAEMDITPMIDCTFLLLIFFLVTSRMKAEAPVELPKARHGLSVMEKDAVILTVVKGEGEQAAVYKGNSTDPAERIDGDVAQQEEEIARYVEQQANTSPPKRYVLIKAEGSIKQRDVARVERAAAQADVEQLYVAVLQTE